MPSKISENCSDAVYATLKGTSFSLMNEWHHEPGRRFPPVQQPMTGQPWFTRHTSPYLRGIQLTPEELEDADKKAREEMQKAKKMQPVELPPIEKDENWQEKYYQKYNEMFHKIPYHHPDRGPPKVRVGSESSSWRNIQQSTDPSGNEVMAIDGLFSSYEKSGLAAKLRAEADNMPHLRGLHVPPEGTPQLPEDPDFGPGAGIPAMSIFRDPNVLRKWELQKRFPTQRRGFYKFLQNPHQNIRVDMS